MKRNFVGCCVLACALGLPTAAWAASSRTAAGSVVASGSSAGTITAVSGSSLTIQTAGRPTGVINALTVAANTVTKHDYPYVYGGGHAEAGVASIGIKGPGYNGRRLGFDCSGSVAAVLAGGGLWPAGGGVPNDAGIVAELLAERLIARGVGAGPAEVTLYDDPGVHIFMNIDGRFFGTSDGGGGGNARGGAGWLTDGAPDASSSVYKRYHFLPSVLKASTNAGHSVTFDVGALESSAGGLEVGEQVQISYQEVSSGLMVATAIAFPGAITTTGTVGSIADDASSFTIQTASGSSLTFSTGEDPQLIDGLQQGDTVQVTYTATGAALTAHVVTVTATPAETGGSAGSGAGGGYGPGGSGEGTHRT